MLQMLIAVTVPQFNWILLGNKGPFVVVIMVVVRSIQKQLRDNNFLVWSQASELSGWFDIILCNGNKMNSLSS